MISVDVIGEFEVERVESGEDEVVREPKISPCGKLALSLSVAFVYDLVVGVTVVFKTRE